MRACVRAIEYTYVCHCVCVCTGLYAHVDTQRSDVCLVHLWAAAGAEDAGICPARGDPLVAEWN